MFRIKYDFQIFLIQKYGGISKYFYYLSKYIKKQNLKSKIIAPIHTNDYLKNTDKKKHIGFYLNTNSNIIKRFLWILNSIIDFIMSKLIFYKINHKTFYSIYSDSYISKKTKVITTIHDMNYELFPKYFKNANTISYKKKLACNQSDSIIAVSNSTKKDLVRLFNVNPDKINVIHHGIDHTIFNKNNKKNQLVSNLEPYILYVGNRHLYKNFNTLLRAFAFNEQLYSHYNLVLFGGEKLSKDEKQFINENEIESKIHLFDGSENLLSSFYNSASVFVYTSIYEGFGMPVLEAMACGCPVIAGNNSSIPEVAEDACLLVDQIESVDIFANKMQYLLSNKNLLFDYSKRGIIQASKFSWEKCAIEHLKVYKSL